MTEEWKPAPGFEGHYSVSNHGRVRRDRGGMGTHVGRILKPQPTGTPDPEGRHYLSVSLCSGIRPGEPRYRRRYIHNLVAELFLGKRPPGMQVNHKNADRHDNRAENLEYVTPKGNIAHAVATGRIRVGEGHKHAKLTNEQVASIPGLRAAGLSQQAIADKFGVSQKLISLIENGVSRRHG